MMLRRLLAALVLLGFSLPPAFAAADDRYTQILMALLAQLKKTS